MKKILFLGLGHLGNFFIKHNQNYSITGTKRHIDPSMNIPIIAYTLGEVWKDSTHFETIIISFPPVPDYSIKLASLLNELPPFKKVIFISSTSVYGTGMITEESIKNSQRRNSIELIKCERLIEGFEDYIIIRPGGLIDQIRHPRNLLKNSHTVKKSKSHVNLVHTYDVASFLHFAIEKNLTNEGYNLVCDDHPTKEKLYRPFYPHHTFDPEDSEQRVIDNAKSKNTGFSYKYSKLEWP